MSKTVKFAIAVFVLVFSVSSVAVAYLWVTKDGLVALAYTFMLVGLVVAMGIVLDGLFSLDGGKWK